MNKEYITRATDRRVVLAPLVPPPPAVVYYTREPSIKNNAALTKKNATRLGCSEGHNYCKIFTTDIKIYRRCIHVL